MNKWVARLISTTLILLDGLLFSQAMGIYASSSATSGRRLFELLESFQTIADAFYSISRQPRRSMRG
jgi:hypothetical protein